MTRNWYHIAKAEFQVQTSGIKKNRAVLMTASFVFGLIWAFAIAPYLIGFVLTEVIGIPQTVLAMVMPGLMRAGMMFVWLLLVFLPLSNALKEIRIGQWEILMSHRVQTREILVGTFAGCLGIYGLYVLYLSPFLVVPFAHAYSVSIIGVGFMYLTIFVITVSTIWLSNLLVTAIQARLGASARGKDLAKGLSIIVSLVAIIPLIGLQLFAPLMTEILGMDFFIVFPFTWGADLLSQIAISFNGIGLPMQALDAVLGFSYTMNAILIGGFCLLIFIIGLVSADRFFIIGETARSETVTTIHQENVALQGVRRILGDSFGVLVVTGLKNFTRKAENLSRLALLLILALMIPVFIFIRAGEFDITTVLVMMSLMLGFLGVQVFGGSGFLESKDQLWSIQAAPQGVQRYIRAKTLQSVILIVPVALFPGVLYSTLLSLELNQVLILIAASFSSCIGGALVGIGIAASNPVYEDTKSGAYRTNNVRGMLLVVLSFMGYLIVDFVLSMIGYSDLMNLLWESQTFSLLVQLVPLPFVGLIVVLFGQHRLSNLE